jgi:hypothetical protein
MLPSMRERIEQEYADYYDTVDRDSLQGVRIGVPQVSMRHISR